MQLTGSKCPQSVWFFCLFVFEWFKWIIICESLILFGRLVRGKKWFERMRFYCGMARAWPKICSVKRCRREHWEKKNSQDLVAGEKYHVGIINQLILKIPRKGNSYLELWIKWAICYSYWSYHSWRRALKTQLIQFYVWRHCQLSIQRCAWWRQIVALDYSYLVSEVVRREEISKSI